MKRFNLFRLVFALVCGCHINGVQSYSCDLGFYLDPYGRCHLLRNHDQSPVIKTVPRFTRCAAVDTTLKVIGYQRKRKVKSVFECKEFCMSIGKCTHFVYNHINRNNIECSIADTKSFGVMAKNTVTGLAVCPRIGKCPRFKVDYGKARYTPVIKNVASPWACQRLCRKINDTVAFNYGLSNRYCYCKNDYSYTITANARYVSGGLLCPKCFGYKDDMSYLPNVYNGGPNNYLIQPTVGACQSSCEANPMCNRFVFNTRNEHCYHKNDITAETIKKKVTYASRDCDITCDCNTDGVVKGDVTCNKIGYCNSCNELHGYTGRGCDRCKTGYFKNGTLCEDCGCNSVGLVSIGPKCDQLGKCNCDRAKGYEGPKCNKCGKGYYKENSECKVCPCHVNGATNCTQNSGKCTCNTHYQGDKCDKCDNDHFMENNVCKSCDCNANGVAEGDFTCDKSGYCKSCDKRRGYTGKRCLTCEPGYFKDGNICKYCGCNRNGVKTCSKNVCQCKPGYKGPKCDQCSDENYMPNGYSKICYPCDCPPSIGVKNKNCDKKTGQCPCFPGYTGKKCEKCIKGHRLMNNSCCPNGDYYDQNSGSCKNCGCNDNGVQDCSKNVCQCKKGYKGPKCDQCSAEHYMPDKNAKICYPCNCPSTGTRNKNCDSTGQCSCYQDSYKGKKCDICVKGQIRTNKKCCYHNDWYDWNKRSCKACGCNSKGMASPQCNDKGRCTCKRSHAGKICDECNGGYYFNINGSCQSFPHNYHGSVLKIIPGFKRCAARQATLKVRQKLYTRKTGSISHCHWYCKSDKKCTHFEFDWNDSSNKYCSTFGMEGFGRTEKNIVTGPGECPKIGNCMNVGIDYVQGKVRASKFNVKSPKDCQKFCRHIGRKAVFSFGFSDGIFSSRDCLCVTHYSFGVAKHNSWISGDSFCPHCFHYGSDLSNLQHVDNGSPNLFLIQPTVKACQRSCKINPLCNRFKFNRRNKHCHHLNDQTAEMKKNNVAYGSRECDFTCYCNHTCNIVGHDDQKGWTVNDCIGIDCKPEYFKDGSICKACGCNRQGVSTMECFQKGGQCFCKYDYTGRTCHNVMTRVYNAGGPYKWGSHHGLLFHCHDKCEIKSIKLKKSHGAKMDIIGSTAYFSKNVHDLVTTGTVFCESKGSSNTDQECVKKVALNQKTFYLGWIAWGYARHVDVQYEIGNFKSVSRHAIN